MVRGMACAIVLASGLLVGPLSAQERVAFPQGAGEATLDGSVAGSASTSYLVSVGAGQTLRLSLDPTNPQTAFNLFAPGDVPGESSALYFGAREGLTFDRPLAEAGDYTVQVFLSRAAARRAETSRFTLSVALSGAGSRVAGAAVPADAGSDGPDMLEVTGLVRGSALNLRGEPGTTGPVTGEFPAGTLLRNIGCREIDGQRWCEVESPDDAALRGWVAAAYLSVPGATTAGPVGAGAGARGTASVGFGQIPCSVSTGQPPVPCAFDVAREGGGRAVVTVTLPAGGARAILFAGVQPVGSDKVGAPFSASRQGDLSRVSVGDERYEIPDRIVLGD